MSRDEGDLVTEHERARSAEEAVLRLLLAEGINLDKPELGVAVLGDFFRKAVAEADSNGYARGRSEALTEAMGVAERRGAKATAKHLQQRYEDWQHYRREYQP